MRSSRRYAALGLLAVLPLAATACGGGKHAATTTVRAPTTPRPTAVASGKQAYVREMHRLGVRIGTEVNEIFPIETGVHGSGTAQKTVMRLERAHTVFEDVLTALQGMKPPAGVAADHKRLETGVSGVAGELTQVIDDLNAGNFEASVVPSRLSDVLLIESATNSMEKKGYDVLGTKG